MVPPGLRTVGWLLLLLGVCGSTLAASLVRRSDHRRVSGELEALRALYQATGGADWRVNTNWMDESVDCCSWHGVGCYYPNSPNVAWLDMAGNNLRGTLPAELGGLDHLEELFVEQNALSGTLPAELLCPGSRAVDTDSGSVPTAAPTRYCAVTSPEENQCCALSSYDEQDTCLAGQQGATAAPTAASTGVDCSLRKVSAHYNQLSGTLPQELSRLPKLEQVQLSNNKLSGTLPSIPLAISDWYVANNKLSGTLTPALASLASLSVLMLSDNRFSGTVPPELSQLGQGFGILLHANSLSGTVPSSFGSLTSIRDLYLHSNRLSGTLPPELATRDRQYVLTLYENRLSGTIAPEFEYSPALLLYDNRLSGTLPAGCFGIPKMAILLHQNRLSGSIPSQIGSLQEMTEILTLQSNRLSGTLPSSLATGMTHLTLGNNRFSGTLPEPLPGQLEVFTAHHNLLSGSLPTFSSLSHLESLALANNHFWGRLVLPRGNQARLTQLVVHQNRLSCPVEHNNTFIFSESNAASGRHFALIAPGNRLSSEGKPSWAEMEGVRFQWTPTHWEEWSAKIVVAAVGTAATGILVVAVLKAEWRTYFLFKPRGIYEQYSWLCLRLLLGLALAALCLVPFYAVGGKEFECGRLWLRGTLAYLSGSPVSEQAVAALACILLGFEAFVVTLIRFWLAAIESSPCKDSDVPLTWRRLLRIVLIWPWMVLLLSVPSFLFVFSQSVPGGSNSMGLSQFFLDVFGSSAGLLVALIESVLVPVAARLVVGSGGVHQVKLMMAAYLMILFVVPFVTAFVFGSDCYNMWVSIWEPCLSSSTAFDMAKSVSGELASYWKQQVNVTFNIPIIAHADVCESLLPHDGHCSRYVIESLALLITEKLIISSFITPFLVILRSFPFAREQLEYLAETYLGRENYTYRPAMDVDIALIGALMAQVLVLAIPVPEVAVLACATLAGKLAAIHLTTSKLGIQWKFRRFRSPGWWSFLVSTMLGYALVLWFYVENASRIHGELVFYVGAPVSLVLGVASAIMAWKRLKVTRPPNDCCESDTSDVDHHINASVHDICLTNEQQEARSRWRRFQVKKHALVTSAPQSSRALNTLVSPVTSPKSDIPSTIGDLTELRYV